MLEIIILIWTIIGLILFSGGAILDMITDVFNNKWFNIMIIGAVMSITGIIFIQICAICKLI